MVQELPETGCARVSGCVRQEGGALALVLC